LGFEGHSINKIGFVDSALSPSEAKISNLAQ